MAHINAIGAGMFSDLSVCTDDALNAAAIADPTEAKLNLAFVATKFSRITGIREFPAMGTPPNIVNVPVYGQSTSQQIQGQSDAPTMEITVNYKPSEWADGSTLGDMVGDGEQRVFRFTLLNSEPPGYVSSPAGATALGGDTSDGTATQNSIYYWIGKVEALLVNPQLTDANTATITISVQSAFFGAFTIDPTA
jgi:hypothetical protein